MNIAKYRLELDENRHNILVKESDLDYKGKCLKDPLAVADMLKTISGCICRRKSTYIWSPYQQTVNRWGFSKYRMGG